ncbi:MAG: heme-binding protein [Catenulispora sp.]|nr:heme-binding protein [Catenulispora sp.]
MDLHRQPLPLVQRPGPALGLPQPHGLPPHDNKTSALVGNLQQNPTLKDIPGTLFLAGGVPVDSASAPIAGIGVAGAPSGALDEAYAQAGADAITKG